MGGAVYMYLRGIDQAGQGVYVHKPPFELIQALDAAFKAPQATTALGMTA
jgi:exodeoxyribonuclease V beta subunit